MKNPKTYIAIILSILVSVPVINNTVSSLQKADIIVDMPNDYKIGELITLDASASKATDLVWKIVPETPNFKVNGKIAFFSSSIPIDFTIIVSGHRNNSLVCKTFELKYRKKATIINTIALTPFEKEVLTWTPANKVEALELAKSFKLIARMIDSGVFETVDGLILATAQANTEALRGNVESWKPFLRNLQEYLETNPPSTVKSHILVWQNVASALEKYAKT